ncbi:MAG: tetratricopeptide repeat protein [Candidatus Xenobiia bacterium LiM19]
MSDAALTLFFIVFAIATISAVRAIVKLAAEIYHLFISRSKLDSIDRKLNERTMSIFEGWMRRGDIHFARGSNHKAISCYREALKNHPLNKVAPFRLGLALYVDNYYRGVEVEEALRNAIEKDESFADAHFILGQFYLELGLFTDAKKEFSQAPEKFNIDDFDFLFSMDDETSVVSQRLEYSRNGYQALRNLFILYMIQFASLIMLFLTHYWLIVPFSLYLLLLQLRNHLSLYEQLTVEPDGLKYRSVFGNTCFAWKEIVNLIRDGEYRIKIVLRDREITINSTWQNFEEINRKLKAQLYFIKWRPAVGVESTCG